MPELSRHQIAAFELLDEPCYVVDLGSAGVVWTNQAARAFWGAHAAGGLAAGAACVDALRGIDAGATDVSRSITLFCDGRLRMLACRVRRIGFDGREAAFLRVPPAGGNRADSEQRFRDFAEAASDWFWETDPGGRFTYVSPSITVATGELPENLIGRTRQEMAKASGRTEALAEIEPILKACARREPFADVVLGRPGPGGELRYVSTSGRPRFDAAGNFLGYRGAGRNITAQVGAERRLAASEQRFRDFVAVSADWYWELDSELRFSFVSASVLDRTGRVPKVLLGQRPSKSRTRNVSDAAWAAHEADLEARRPFVDFRFEGQDGRGRKRYFTSSGKPVFDAEGRFLGYRGTGRDITDLVETENALRASEQRFRDFAEVASDVTWEMGPDLRLTYVSDGIEPISGLPAAWYVGKRNIDLDPDDPQRVRLERMLEDRRTIREFPFSRPRPDGRVVHLTYGAKPVFAEDGRFLGYRGTVRDVTAQREAELETGRLRKVRDLAAAADMAKTRFLANMSHELRTPLNAILGFAQVLAGEMLGPLGAPAYRAYAHDIESSGRRLLAIISDLLDMSRIELNEFQLTPEPVGLAALIGDCVTSARAASSAESAPIVVAPIDPDWVLDVDRRALRQVVIKLLANALKFTPPAGRIAVELRQDRTDSVALAVSDTGCGIAAERMATLFEPFQRSAGEVSRGGNGAGLGLWVSRALIELHGGSLVLSSTVGQGTVAVVTLPGVRVRQRPQLRIAS